jgi:hypothetical protein
MPNETKIEDRNQDGATFKGKKVYEAPKLTDLGVVVLDTKSSTPIYM